MPNDVAILLCEENIQTILASESISPEDLNGIFEKLKVYRKLDRNRYYYMPTYTYPTWKMAPHAWHWIRDDILEERYDYDREAIKHNFTELILKKSVA